MAAKFSFEEGQSVTPHIHIRAHTGIFTEPKINIRTLTIIKVCHKITLTLPKNGKMPTNKHKDKVNFTVVYREVTPPIIHSPLHISKTPVDNRGDVSSITVPADWDTQTNADPSLLDSSLATA
jgi:hypothetical protein